MEDDTRPKGWETFIMGINFQLGLYDFHCSIIYLGGTSREYSVAIRRYPLIDNANSILRTFEANSPDDAVRDGMKIIGEMLYEQMKTFDYSQHEPAEAVHDDVEDRIERGIDDIEDKIEDMQKEQYAINLKLDRVIDVLFPNSKKARRPDHYESEGRNEE